MTAAALRGRCTGSTQPAMTPAESAGVYPPFSLFVARAGVRPHYPTSVPGAMRRDYVTSPRRIRRCHDPFRRRNRLRGLHRSRIRVTLCAGRGRLGLDGMTAAATVRDDEEREHMATEMREQNRTRTSTDPAVATPIGGAAQEGRSATLAARLEPFDSYWQAPADVDKGFGSFRQYYRHNYLPHMPADRAARILVVRSAATRRSPRRGGQRGG